MAIVISGLTDYVKTFHLNSQAKFTVKVKVRIVFCSGCNSDVS